RGGEEGEKGTTNRARAPGAGASRCAAGRVGQWGVCAGGVCGLRVGRGGTRRWCRPVSPEMGAANGWENRWRYGDERHPETVPGGCPEAIPGRRGAGVREAADGGGGGAGVG